MNRASPVHATPAGRPAASVPRRQVVAAYVRARRRRFADRQALHRWQAPRLRRALERARAAYPFYRDVGTTELADFPVLDKAVWLDHFAELNLPGLTLAQCLAAARQAEGGRRFDTQLRGLSVGLSTGTSGRQAAFLTSPAERATWAGTMLARALPPGRPRRERVALVLRAGGPLYETVGGAAVSFHFVDLFRPLHEQVAQLRRIAPTVLAAPPVWLDLFAAQAGSWREGVRPRVVFSVADVLDPDVQQRVEAAFQLPLRQIYQATEGFLGISCGHGTVHLNEDLLVVEREVIDSASGRFVPVVTDLWRTSQAVVRYRMGDVLVPAPGCPCGSAFTPIARIEGRSDDVVLLPPAAPGTSSGAVVPVFADAIRSAILGTAGVRDFAFVQTGPLLAQLSLDPPDRYAAALASLDGLWQRAQVRPPVVTPAAYRAVSSSAKARRVRRAFEPPGGRPTSTLTPDR